MGALVQKFNPENVYIMLCSIGHKKEKTEYDLSDFRHVKKTNTRNIIFDKNLKELKIPFNNIKKRNLFNITKFVQDAYSLSVFIENRSKYNNLENNIDYVFCPAGDNHTDHEIVNQITHEKFRPLKDNKLKGIFEYELPSSGTLLNKHFNYPNFNFNFDFSKKIFEKKKNLLENYVQVGALRENGDMRSKQFVLNYHKLQGQKYGKYAAEQFRSYIFRL